MFLFTYDISNIVAFDQHGMVNKESKNLDELQVELLNHLNDDVVYKNLSEAMVGSDVFIGVSVANLLSIEMVESMAPNAIVFAMANPNPEISYDDAKKAGALIVGTVDLIARTKSITFSYSQVFLRVF